MPKRNWTAIANLSDSNTRYAISQVTDPEILACYERGFPHLFEEGDDEGPLIMPPPVPLSELMEAAAEHTRSENPDSSKQSLDWQENDRHFGLVMAANIEDRFDLPVAFSWGPEAEYPAVPLGILEQFVGQKAEAPLMINYRGKSYVVVNAMWTGQAPKIGIKITEVPEIHLLMLTDANLIALDK